MDLTHGTGHALRNMMQLLSCQDLTGNLFGIINAQRTGTRTEILYWALDSQDQGYPNHGKDILNKNLKPRGKLTVLANWQISWYW